MRSFIVTLWLAMSLAACPNNCNGHGQCKNGKCECNTQKGLGLGAGSENYQSYTGTCPLGFPFGYISPIITTSKTILYGSSRTLAGISFQKLDITLPSPYNTSVYSVRGADWIDQLGPEGGQLYCKDTRDSVSNPYSGSATVYYVNGGGEAIVQYSFKVANESSYTTDPEEEGGTEVNNRLLFEDRRIDVDDSTTDDDTEAPAVTTEPPTTAPPVTPAPVKNPTLPPTPNELSCKVTSKSNDLSMRAVGKANDKNQITLTRAYDLFKEMGFKIGDSIRADKPNFVGLKFACYSKGTTAQSYGYPVNEYPIKEATEDRKNIKFEVDISKSGDLIHSGDKISTCYLLSNANGTSIDIGNSDVAKTILIQGDDKSWYYPAPSSSGAPADAIPNTEDGSVKLIVNEDVGKKIVNFFIYGTTDKDTSKDTPVAAEKKLIVPLPTDENKGTVKAQVYPGAMISMTIIYTIIPDGDTSKAIGPFTYSTQSQVIASADYTSMDIKGMLVKSYPEFELAEIFEPESVDYRRMRVLATGDTFNVDNIIINTENCEERVDKSDPTKPGQNTTLPEKKLCPHKAIECSGAGLCDRITGQCNCYDGFSGDACQRMDCPNNCNNNGRCVLLKEVLSQETNLDYMGYGATEKVYGCLCDPGRRGPDCSLLECPSAEDPLKGTNVKDGSGVADIRYEHRDCSGRGNCDYETGTCKCFSGYYGEACQIRASTN